jgi:hypothetical protein
MIAYCSCLEIIDNNGNEYQNIPRWHSCNYIAKRNNLIPLAYKYAEENAKDMDGKVNGYRFTQLFSNEMDRLAKEAKLT